MLEGALLYCCSMFKLFYATEPGLLSAACICCSSNFVLVQFLFPIAFLSFLLLFQIMIIYDKFMTKESAN